MNKWIASLVGGLSLLMLFSGCMPQPQAAKMAPEPEKKVIIQKVDKEDIRQVMREEKLLYINNAPERVFEVMGEGIAPQNTISPAQAMALAKELLWLMRIAKWVRNSTGFGFLPKILFKMRL